MALLRVDARALVPRLRAELAALLTSLTSGDWALPTACPGWSVHDVAAHLRGAAACQARTTVAGALKLYARDPSAPPLTWRGDREIAGALAGVKAVLG